MKTLRLLGIIGDPISHSLSPAMHNAVLRKGGFRFFYLPFHVTPRRLRDFLRDVPNLHLKGFNVTIPHKEAVLPSLDWISPEAKAIGAVNTVVVSEGKLKGHNTDALGFLKSLTEATRFRPRGRRALVLGAGGAARAVVYALVSAGAREVIVVNRTLARARDLIREFGKRFPKTSFAAAPIDREILAGLFSSSDLLVNTTSVGLNGSSFKVLPLGALKKKAVVSDLVYRPLMTPLLRAAKRRGFKIHTGDGMLLHQGALSFRLWTGKKPDLRVMRKALLEALKKR